MSETKTAKRFWEVFRALLGMSRAPVAIFVVAHAGLAATFALGKLPSLRVIFIGILASITGTASLIGLNDLLDVDYDRKKIQFEQQHSGVDIGSTFVHHPIARGAISLSTGIIWVLSLSILSVFLITLLRPNLWPILLVIAVLVTFYSKLSSITYWKLLAVAGAVTLGAIAGWLAVSPTINKQLIIFALWSFVWEIGGRNVPNDFNDVEEDSKLGTKTIPTVFGGQVASKVIFVFLMITFIISIVMVFLTPFNIFFKVAAIVVGLYLLIIPAFKLISNPTPSFSVKLYNKSAFYPLVLLLVLMVSLLIK
jgi:4-hydroxybenzoate polyprenyltransferase